MKKSYLCLTVSILALMNAPAMAEVYSVDSAAAVPATLTVGDSVVGGVLSDLSLTCLSAQTRALTLITQIQTAVLRTCTAGGGVVEFDTMHYRPGPTANNCTSVGTNYVQGIVQAMRCNAIIPPIPNNGQNINNGGGITNSTNGTSSN